MFGNIHHEPARPPAQLTHARHPPHLSFRACEAARRYLFRAVQSPCRAPTTLHASFLSSLSSLLVTPWRTFPPTTRSHEYGTVTSLIAIPPHPGANAANAGSEPSKCRLTNPPKFPSFQPNAGNEANAPDFTPRGKFHCSHANIALLATWRPLVWRRLLPPASFFSSPSSFLKCGIPDTSASGPH